MSADKFVRASLRSLSDALHRLGHPASPPTVARLLRDQKYNLRVNVKRLTGPPHPDRDRQFRHIREKIAEFRAEGWPVLSVDSKKKELIGDFRNAGAVWCRTGAAVNAHDFPSDALCKAVPYGLYDVLGNRGTRRGGDLVGHTRLRDRCHRHVVGPDRVAPLPARRSAVGAGGRGRE
ncbi:Rhodopirellula transposase [Gemmata sp. SH-PL17]|uniref:ISAzo13-like element transposase-related protein n=1 Tax=Gemmata sp. SH-PL17 TaxID=1630693 RepID=UPI00078C9BAB|nr:hypothetical protein [Gemmata sp. SH-PL17]AMV24052.1 Rhodopirellula transposase [Gemmata sp. SH-PL17]